MAARALPPATEGGSGVDDDGPSTSSASSFGGRRRATGPWAAARRAAQKVIDFGDSPRPDATGGGRYGGGAINRRRSLDDEQGVASYAALHRPAGRSAGLPPWWAAAWRGAVRRVRAWRYKRALAAEEAAAAAARRLAASKTRPPVPTTRLGRWLSDRRATAAFRSLAATRAIAARAAWVRRYARANTVGLRKIVKKYGKMCGDPDAGRLLQAFWAGDAPRARTGFLTSPLVAELRVLEVLLSHDRAVTLAGAGGVDGPPAPPAEAATADGVPPSQELPAPAPLDPLARPGSGHHNPSTIIII